MGLIFDVNMSADMGVDTELSPMTQRHQDQSGRGQDDGRHDKRPHRLSSPFSPSCLLLDVMSASSPRPSMSPLNVNVQQAMIAQQQGDAGRMQLRQDTDQEQQQQLQSLQSLKCKYFPTAASAIARWKHLALTRNRSHSKNSRNNSNPNMTLSNDCSRSHHRLVSTSGCSANASASASICAHGSSNGCGMETENLELMSDGMSSADHPSSLSLLELFNRSGKELFGNANANSSSTVQQGQEQDDTDAMMIDA